MVKPSWVRQTRPCPSAPVLLTRRRGAYLHAEWWHGSITCAAVLSVVDQSGVRMAAAILRTKEPRLIYGSPSFDPSKSSDKPTRRHAGASLLPSPFLIILVLLPWFPPDVLGCWDAGMLGCWLGCLGLRAWCCASKSVKVSTDGEGCRDHVHATGTPLPCDAAATHGLPC